MPRDAWVPRKDDTGFPPVAFEPVLQNSALSSGRVHTRSDGIESRFVWKAELVCIRSIGTCRIHELLAIRRAVDVV